MQIATFEGNTDIEGNEDIDEPQGETEGLVPDEPDKS